MNDHMMKAIAEKKKKALEIKLSVDPETHEVSMSHSGQDGMQEGSPAEEKAETPDQEKAELTSDLAPSVKDGGGDAGEIDNLKMVMGEEDKDQPEHNNKPMGLREKAKMVMKKKVDSFKK